MNSRLSFILLTVIIYFFDTDERKKGRKANKKKMLEVQLTQFIVLQA